ncbi:MAG TPA: ABC transporter ATP-binding protein [Chloroflexota bacterium]|nr:ABC transporter ATP-binding protein [Chloroflexota bacterium]
MTAGPSPGAPLLRVSNLRRSYGGVHAVDGASFEVRPGTITGLIGPNGAGKSTAIGMIAGAIVPSDGIIEFAERQVTRDPAYQMARRGLTRTFQLSSEFAKLTVLENLLIGAPGQRGESLWGALLGKRYWRRQERALVEQARDLLGRFAMTEKEEEYAGNLSGGQKRLVEIMRALMARPRLLLLDEPMAGVNPTLAGRIAGYLEELRDGGLTMLMVEHELAHVDRLCNPVIVMAQGKVLAEGTMAELRARRDVVDAYLVG